MTLSEVLWAPQAKHGWVHSNQKEQESSKRCEGVIEGGPVK